MHAATVHAPAAPHALAHRVALTGEDAAREPVEAPRHPGLVARASR